MVIVYRDKFLKVFLITVAFWVVGLGLAVYSSNMISSAMSNPTRGQTANISRLLSISNVSIILGWIGFIFSVWSSILLAKAKGYGIWVGLLFTLLIVFILPDRRKLG